MLIPYLKSKKSGFKDHVVSRVQQAKKIKVTNEQVFWFSKETLENWHQGQKGAGDGDTKVRRIWSEWPHRKKSHLNLPGPRWAGAWKCVQRSTVCPLPLDDHSTEAHTEKPCKKFFLTFLSIFIASCSIFSSKMKTTSSLILCGVLLVNQD